MFFFSSCTTYKHEAVFVKNEKIEYQNEYIKTSRYKGVIFSENYTIQAVRSNENKFTPTIFEIETAEKILRKGIKAINKERPNQIEKCPIIDKNLTRYKRQYFGHINSLNEKIILIVCYWDGRNRFYEFWDKYILKEPEDNYWLKEEMIIMDGCSNYWIIEVNLTQRKLFNFGVNGFG